MDRVRRKQTSRPGRRCFETPCPGDAESGQPTASVPSRMKWLVGAGAVGACAALLWLPAWEGFVCAMALGGFWCRLVDPPQL
jgi:hypothetical protein